MPRSIVQQPAACPPDQPGTKLCSATIHKEAFRSDKEQHTSNSKSGVPCLRAARHRATMCATTRVFYTPSIVLSNIPPGNMQARSKQRCGQCLTDKSAAKSSCAELYLAGHCVFKLTLASRVMFLVIFKMPPQMILASHHLARQQQSRMLVYVPYNLPHSLGRQGLKCVKHTSQASYFNACKRLMSNINKHCCMQLRICTCHSLSLS